MTEATAPGKLVLVGEYAVLDGAPAIVSSFGVRARVKVVAISGDESIFFDAASGRAFYFVIDGEAGLRWVDGGPDKNGGILEAVVSSLVERSQLFDDGPSFRISMDTNDFFTRVNQRWLKLGLGSSSAVLVALTGALVSALNLTMTPADLLAVCYSAHRRFQGGRGSGIDIASAVYGGVLTVRPDQSGGPPRVTPGVWPQGLLALPVWSGNSASTPELLRRYQAFCSDNPDDYRRHLRRLKALAEQACVAWSDQSVIDILNALAGYDDAMRVLDSEACIGIVSEPHARLREIAEQYGAVYRISGAGGGDFGIVLTDSEKIIEEVRIACRDDGFSMPENEFAVEGLSVD